MDCRPKYTGEKLINFSKIHMRKTHYLGIGKYFLSKTSKLLTIKGEKKIKLYPIKIKKFGSSKDTPK